MPLYPGFWDRKFDTENAERRLQQGDLRNMQKAQCSKCNYVWWAPKIGNCPQCRSPHSHILEQKEIGAPRV